MCKTNPEVDGTGEAPPDLLGPIYTFAPPLLLRAHRDACSLLSFAVAFRPKVCVALCVSGGGTSLTEKQNKWRGVTLSGAQLFVSVPLSFGLCASA